MADLPAYLIAVDGGGTGCRVAVGTAQDGVQATAKGGPANVSTAFDTAVKNIARAISEAAQTAQWPAGALAQATTQMGLAGADLPAVQQKTAARFDHKQVHVSGDRQTTVAGALGDQDGFVLGLGTGTIIARQQAGQIKTVSGWGFQLSDQASGAWLGRRMLARTLDAIEGIEPQSPLSQALADRMGGVQGVFAFSTTAAPADYAGLAPEVFAAGQKGDAIAVDLLRTGAAYLGRGLAALGYAPGDVLCLTGGVGPHYAAYLAPDLTGNVQKPRGNALDGAFAQARKRAAE